MAVVTSTTKQQEEKKKLQPEGAKPVAEEEESSGAFLNLNHGNHACSPCGGVSEQELLLPSASSSCSAAAGRRLVGVGHDEEWIKLVNAYRRAAGAQEDKAGLNDKEKDVNGSGSMGPQMVVVKGESGTGKTLLIQRLRHSVVQAFQSRYDAHQQAMEAEARAIDEANKQQQQQDQKDSKQPLYYHDDGTISTKSGGFLMPNVKKESDQKTSSGGPGGDGHGEVDKDPDRHLFEELPTGLFAQGTFTAGTTKVGTTTTSSEAEAAFPLTAIMESFNDILDQLLNNDLIELDSIQQSLLNALNMGMSTSGDLSQEEDAPLLAKLVTLFPSLIYLFDPDPELGQHMMTLQEEDGEDDEDNGEEEEFTPRSSNIANNHEMMDNIGMAKFTETDGTETTATGRLSRRRSSLLSLQEQQHQHKEFIMDEPDSPIRGIQFLIKCFIKAMTDIVQKHYGGPIVLFLDNAQCMDPTSAEFLNSCLLPLTTTSSSKRSEENSELQNLLIILAVQTTEQQEIGNGSLIKKLHLPAFYNHHCTEDILLKNLTPHQVHTLITRAMRQDRMPQPTKQQQLPVLPSTSPTPTDDSDVTDDDDDAGAASDGDVPTEDAIVCDPQNAPSTSAPAPLPIEPLVDFVYEQTQGNGFNVVELLRSLSDKNLITFCSDTRQWTYQMESIQEQDQQVKKMRKNKDDDDAWLFYDLIKDKIQTRLSKEARFILVMAACLQQHSSTNRDIEKELLAHVVLEYYPTDSENKWSSWVSNHFQELGQAMDWCPDTLTVEMDVLLHVETLVTFGLLERVVLPGPNQASATASGSHHRASSAGGSPGATSVLRFTHECVRQAALECIPQDVSGQILHMRVGEILKDMVLTLEGVAVAAQETSWMLFTCLDHLHQGPTELLREHESELVHLNEQAAEQAIDLYAYHTASTYYGVAIDWLLKKLSRVGTAGVSLGGQLDSLLLIKLRTQLSVCHFRLGNLSESESLAKNALSSTMGFSNNSALALQYKLPLYYNLIAIHKAQGNLEESVNIGIELLNEVGEKFSKKPSRLRVAMENRKIQKRLCKQNVANLSHCINPLKGAVINTYAVLCDPMSVLGYSSAATLLQLRSVYLTLKYGSSHASALAFACYSSYLISQGDIDGGHQFGKCSMRLLGKSNSEDLTSRTILVANSTSLQWKDPPKKTLDWQRKGYKLGCMNGSIEIASASAALYHSYYYYSGLPLKVGQLDLQKSIRQMGGNQSKELSQCKALLQTQLNLMGRGNRDPTEIMGDTADQSELSLLVMKSYQMQLAYYFGKLDLAQSLMDELRSYANLPVAPCIEVACRFFFGLIRIAQARRLPPAKCAALLKKLKKEDVQWLELQVRQGATNCFHKLLILRAEISTFDAFKDEIEQSFDNAVVTAGRYGFSQDEALANELGAAHFLSSGDFSKGSGLLKRAYELYGAWGARGKVKQMEEKYVLIKPPDLSSSGFGTSSSGRKATSKGTVRTSVDGRSATSLTSATTGTSTLVELRSRIPT